MNVCSSYFTSLFMSQRYSIVGLVLLVFILPGCELFQKSDPEPKPEGSPPPMMTYEALRAKFNARIDPLKQLWTRGVVELRWKDEDDKDQFEQGDFILITRKPHDLAVKIFKDAVGLDLAWVGSDAKQFWVFDLNPPKGQPVAVRIGDATRELSPRTGLPIPIHPHQLIDLLGITPLPAVTDAKRPPIVTIDKQHRYRVWRPLQVVEGKVILALQLHIHPVTMRIERMMIADHELRVWLDAELSRYEAVDMFEVPLGARVSVPTRIEVKLPQRRTTVTLYLSNPEDGKERERVRDVQFDLLTLIELHEAEKVIHLNPDTDPNPETNVNP